MKIKGKDGHTYDTERTIGHYETWYYCVEKGLIPLRAGDRITVPHTENYPDDLLPNGCHFEHCCNTGNPYDGLKSILEVVRD